MEKATISNLSVSESELNNLLREALEGIRDDVKEAQENADLYLQALLNEDGGKGLYGRDYCDALRIKGQARALQLKFIDMFKDRVTKLEIQRLAKKDNEGVASTLDHAELNKVLSEMSIPPSSFEIKPVIQSKRVTDEDNYENDELDLDEEEG